MKSFLLLILSLTAGCEAFEVKGCEGGWVELTCKYPKEDQQYEKIEVVKPRGTIINTTKKDVWEKDGRFSLYHDTRNKNLRMVIKQLEHGDFGKYNCKFYQEGFSSRKQELELKVVKDVCQTPFTQTAYETAKTTITCDFPDEYNFYDKSICKDNNEICEEILSTSVKSSGTFTLTDTNRFNMSISNVSSQHAGVYWCGVILNIGSYRASRKKIQLEIKKITSFKRSSTIGQNFTYWCEYPQDAPIKKFICKGEDPSICQPLWSTSKPKTNTGKFSMEDDRVRRNIIITVRNITTDDAGTYWCGAENTDKRSSKTFFHKLEMTVASTPPTTTPGSVNHRSGSTSPVTVITAPTTTTTTTTSASESAADVTDTTGAVIPVVLLLLLFLVIIVIFIYKRFLSSRNTRNEAAAQQVREDNTFGELQERPQETGSENAVETVYAIANFSTN